MNYLEFVEIVQSNPSLRTYSSRNLANKLKVTEDEIKEFREWYKAKTPIGTPSSNIQSGSYLHKEILDSIPSMEELEKSNYKLDPRLPESINGYVVSSFCKDKVWYRRDEESSQVASLDLDTLKRILQKETTPIKSNKLVKGKILTITYCDAHIGLQVDKSAPISTKVLNFKESLLKALDLITEPFEEVIIVYGGDMVDSNNNFTNRGGHYLPSTMTDREMFETFIEGSKCLFESLVSNPLVGKIRFYSVAEDNHTGLNAGIQSRALEIWLNAKYPDIVTNVFTENIGSYKVKEHTYLLLHGKDSKHQFKGQPLILDTKTESYLLSWCQAKGINPDYKTTHVIKADLHQSSYQLGRFFSYLNCLSMQIGSNWQQLNFMNSQPGITYSIQSDNGVMNGELFL